MTRGCCRPLAHSPQPPSHACTTKPSAEGPFSQPEAEDVTTRVTSRSEFQNWLKTGRPLEGSRSSAGRGGLSPSDGAPTDNCPAPLNSRFGAPQSTGGWVSPCRKTQHSHWPQIDPKQPTPPIQTLWGFPSSHPDVTPKRLPSCGFFGSPSVVHFGTFSGIIILQTGERGS